MVGGAFRKGRSSPSRLLLRRRIPFKGLAARVRACFIRMTVLWIPTGSGSKVFKAKSARSRRRVQSEKQQKEHWANANMKKQASRRYNEINSVS
jgi:hypothetical protein